MIKKFNMARINSSDRNVKASVEQIKQATYINNIENKTKINELIDGLDDSEQSITQLGDRVTTAEGTISGHTIEIEDLQDYVFYTTGETVIGKWINDKPLYRKVIDIGNLPNNTAKTVSTGLTINSSNCIIIKMYGIANYSNGSSLPLPFVSISGYNVTIHIDTSNNLVIGDNTDRSEASGYVILEYIKATD